MGAPRFTAPDPLAPPAGPPLAFQPWEGSRPTREALVSASSDGCNDKKGCTSGCNPLRRELQRPLGASRPKRRPVSRESKKLRTAPDVRQGRACWRPAARLQTDYSARRKPVSCSDSHLRRRSAMTAASPARDRYDCSERGNARTMSSSFTSSWEPCDSLLLEEH